jgi:O-antigen/teichoic acid export membrane protein/SAM-dependent methyltransferase
MSTDNPIADISGEVASAGELHQRRSRLWARQSELRASVGAAIARGVNLVLGLGTSIILARSLGPEHRGTLAVVMSLTGLGIQISNFGFSNSLPYFIARNPDTAAPLLRRALRLTALLSVVWALGLFAYVWISAPAWNGEIGWPLTILSAVLVPMNVLLLLAQGASLGTGHIGAFAWSDVVTRLISVVALGALFAAGVLSAGAAAFVSAVVAMLVGLALCFRIGNVGREGTAPPITPVLDEIRYGWRSGLACMLAIIPTRMLSIAVASRAGAGDAGQFAVSLSIVESVAGVLAAFVVTRMVKMTRAASDRDALRTEVVTAATIVTAGALALCAITAAAAHWLLPLVFGSRFYGAVAPTLWALPGVVAMSIGAVAQTVLAARGLPVHSLAAPSVAIAAAAAFLWLRPSLDAADAGIAYSIQAGAFAIAAVMAAMHHDRISGTPSGLRACATSEDPLPPENSYGSRSRLEWIRRNLEDGARVAEFGCGTGLMVTAPLKSTGIDVTGWDIHAPSVDFGREWLRSRGRDPDILRNQPFEQAEPGSFDAIIASEVLEHLDDATLRACLADIRARLRPNGTLLVTVPNGFGWFEADQRLFERVIQPIDRRLRLIRLIHGVKQLLLGDRIVPGFPSTLADGVSPHVQWFSARTIARVLEENGFEVLSLEGGTMASGPCIDLAITGIRPATVFNGFLGRMFPALASSFRIVAKARQDRK